MTLHCHEMAPEEIAEAAAGRFEGKIIYRGYQIIFVERPALFGMQAEGVEAKWVRLPGPLTPEYRRMLDKYDYAVPYHCIEPTRDLALKKAKETIDEMWAK